MRCFLSNTTWPTQYYPPSLHDALPICRTVSAGRDHFRAYAVDAGNQESHQRPGDRDHETGCDDRQLRARRQDRKSTRLNSSHSQSSYAVFCLKKKTKKVNKSTTKVNCR